jgi:hypothetical protein
MQFGRYNKSVSVEPEVEMSSRASHAVVHVVFQSYRLHFLYTCAYVVTLNTHYTAGINILMTNQIKFYKELSTDKIRVMCVWMPRMYSTWFCYVISLKWIMDTHFIRHLTHRVGPTASSDRIHLPETAYAYQGAQYI